MDALSCMQRAIDFIEENLFDDISPEAVAAKAYMSRFYFQKMFAIVCNMTLGDYIRNRRLTEAAAELQVSEVKIIDMAFRCGYESPESFSRAFSRYHGLSPMAARSQKGSGNALAKISVQSVLGGRHNMQNLKQRGYAVKENGAVYHTRDMDKTAKWFEDVLGWYAGVDGRDKDGKPQYGCATPVPGELINMKIAAFNGIHLFCGEPGTQTVAFIRVEGVDELHRFVKQGGWDKISEVSEQPWGGRECAVTTIDGNVIRFFELS